MIHAGASASVPGDPVALCGQGLAAEAKGDVLAAEWAYRHAVAAAPDCRPALRALGSLLAREGRPDALAPWRVLAALDPDDADAANNLGVLLRAAGDQNGAKAAYAQALAAQPSHRDAPYNLGRALLHEGKAMEAARWLCQATAIVPDDWTRHHALGQALQQAGHLEEAESAYVRALGCAPESVATLNNLASTQQAQGRLSEALVTYDRALGCHPEHPDIRYNRALLLLLMGRHTQGWIEHEWRWRAPGFTAPRRRFSVKQWDGGQLPGGTLLVHAEQGLGDTIQFVRYAAAARARVARLVVEAPACLMPLLQGVAGVDAVTALGATPPAIDAHVPMLTLPLLLGHDAALAAPYLQASAARIAHWREALDSAGADVRPVIGVVWAGNPKHGNDCNRSIRLGTLAPLIRDPRWRWISLQVPPRPDDIGAAGLGDHLREVGHLLHDMAETAACVSAMDAVVAVDTAVAHVAAATGMKVALLVPFAPDWRWGPAGTTTPWYPSMRLFRQPAPGCWEQPVANIGEFLKNRE